MATDGVIGRWRVVVPEDEKEATAVAGRLGLETVLKDEDWRLIREEGRWRLEDRDGRHLRIDFDEPGPDYHRRILRGKGELAARALGAAKGVRRVVDLSAGLGQDAVFLSQLNFKVTGIERHPVIGFLLERARAASTRSDLGDLTFVTADARDWLSRSDVTERFDAAYFDPMYPIKKKSALPRQEMVLFRALVGDDADAAETAALARELLPRLVIKRPSQAPPLLDKPVAAFEGKTVRYDVYAR